MEKLEVLKFPDSRLRYKANPIEKVTPELVQLSKDMLGIMYKQGGVGLAAIQVNKQVRLLVTDTSSEFTSTVENTESPSKVSADTKSRYETSTLSQKLVTHIKQPLILFNPEIINTQGSVVYQEGCLSFPSYFAEVKRAEIVKVKALNEKGHQVCIETDGLLSICLQHEIDHLDGKLFIDHLSSLKASKLREEIKKYGYPDPIQSRANEG